MTDDLPPDLERLRTLERYLELQLAAVQEAIRQQQEQPAEKPARPARWWLAEYEGGELIQVHRGTCNVTGERTKRIGEDAARRGITQSGACQFCRPDTELGIVG